MLITCATHMRHSTQRGVPSNVDGQPLHFHDSRISRCLLHSCYPTTAALSSIIPRSKLPISFYCSSLRMTTKRSASAAFTSHAAAKASRRRPNDIHPAAFLPGLDELLQNVLMQQQQPQKSPLEDQEQQPPPTRAAAQDPSQFYREKHPTKSNDK